MKMSPLFKKISTIFVAVFVCLVILALPQKTGAQNTSIFFPDGNTGFSSSIYNRSFERSLAQSAGYRNGDLSKGEFSTTWNQGEWVNGGQVGRPTYYGRLITQGQSPEQAEETTSRWFQNMYGAVNLYKTLEERTNSILPANQTADGWTNYKFENQAQIDAINRQAEQVLKIKEIADQAGYDTREMQSAVRLAQHWVDNIRAGKVNVGDNYSAHSSGTLEKSDRAGGKIYDQGGNLVSESRDTTGYSDIYCYRDPPGIADLVEVNVQGCIGLGLYYGLLKPSSWVLWASGVAFNYSIDFTLNFGKFIRDQGLGTSGSGAIYLGWSAIRDLINVGFIFILLYAGIATILGLDSYGVKQTIIKVVIAALLLNFSLFFTKAAIDLSNLVALQFYTRVLSAANQANSGGTEVRGSNKDGDWDAGLSIGFVNALGLKSIWTAKNTQENEAQTAFGNITPGNLIIICLGGSAFILVTAFTLFMATIRFLFRSIVLIFLMILSPVGFVGGAIPALSGAASKWRNRLKDNLIFAPAYMAIFYVVSLIVFGKGIGPDQVGVNSGAGLTGFGALFQGDVSNTGILFWFIMIIGMMIGTQLAADSFADKFGGKFSEGAGKWAKGLGKNAAGGFGLAGYTGRRALGATGNIMTGRVGQALLLNGLTRNLGGDKLYNKLGNLKDVKVGKKSLTDVIKEKKTTSGDVYKKQIGINRKRGESKSAYEKRSKENADRVAKTYYGAEDGIKRYADGKPIPDAAGNVQYTGKLDWTAAEARENETFGKSRRKMAMDRVGEAKKGPPKDRSVGDLEKRMAEIAEELKGTEYHPDDPHALPPGISGPRLAPTLPLISKVESQLLKYTKAMNDYESNNQALILAGNSTAVEVMARLSTLVNTAKAQQDRLKNTEATLAKQIADMNAKV